MTDKKKLLLVYHRIPYPIRNGSDKARFALLRVLSEFFMITLICPDPHPDSRKDDIAKVERFCERFAVVRTAKSEKSLIGKVSQMANATLAGVPLKAQNKLDQRFLSAVLDEIKRERYDFVQLFSQVTAVYAKLIRKAEGDVRLIVGPSDDWYLHEKTKRAHHDSFLKRVLDAIELRSIKSWQNQYISHADHALFYSREDIESIKRNLENPAHENRIHWLPGITEVDDSWNEDKLDSVKPNSIAFVGGLGPWFNRQAVIHFAERILPLVHRKLPEATFYVIGYNPGNVFSVDDLKYRQGVEIVGEVDDIGRELEKAAVFVSPVLSGAGVKTKVIEALRFGKPVVSTRKGVGGLWETGPIRVEDTEKGFAERVVELLSNKDLLRQASNESRALYENEYSEKVLSARIGKIYEEAILT